MKQEGGWTKPENFKRVGRRARGGLEQPFARFLQLLHPTLCELCELLLNRGLVWIDSHQKIRFHRRKRRERRKADLVDFQRGSSRGRGGTEKTFPNSCDRFDQPAPIGVHECPLVIPGWGRRLSTFCALCELLLNPGLVRIGMLQQTHFHRRKRRERRTGKRCEFAALQSNCWWQCDDLVAGQALRLPVGNQQLES